MVIVKSIHENFLATLALLLSVALGAACSDDIGSEASETVNTDTTTDSTTTPNSESENSGVTSNQAACDKLIADHPNPLDRLAFCEIGNGFERNDDEVNQMCTFSWLCSGCEVKLECSSEPDSPANQRCQCYYGETPEGSNFIESNLCANAASFEDEALLLDTLAPDSRCFNDVPFVDPNFPPNPIEGGQGSESDRQCGENSFDQLGCQLLGVVAIPSETQEGVAIGCQAKWNCGPDDCQRGLKCLQNSDQTAIECGCFDGYLQTSYEAITDAASVPCQQLDTETNVAFESRVFSYCF